jgi:8-oxo-dGTP diphosphatase
MENARLAVKAFVVQEDRVLIVQRDTADVQQPGIWELPGGRLDIGEDPFLGLQREVKEEVGFDVDVLYPLTVRYFTRSDGQIVTMIIFVCTPQATDITLSAEHSGYAWVNIATAKEQINEFFYQEVEEYVRRCL